MLVVLAVLNEKLAWYVARAGGLLAWALVTASIVLGLALATRVVRRKGLPAWQLDLHRFLGTLAVVFTAVHVLALVADSYVHFGLGEVLVPMASSWRPGAVAWGVVGLYLLAAIQLSSWLMRRLPRRVWHGIHLSSFGLFAVATLHGIQAGADVGNLLVQWLLITGSSLVVFLTLFRQMARRPTRRLTRNGAPRLVAGEG